MEKAIELLKVFLEKHLFPTIIGFVGAIAIYILTPDSNRVLIKLGIILYVVFFWASLFLFVELVIFLYCSIRSLIEKRNTAKQSSEIEEERVKKEKEKNLELLWNSVDELTPNLRKCIKELLENNNTALSLGYLEHLDPLGRCFFNETNITDHGQKRTMIKLKSNRYEELKNSYEKYGRISHFE